MALIKCPDCEREVSDVAPACPGCGRPIAAGAVTAPQQAPPAKLRRRSETFGEGCMLQGVGCLGGLAMIALIPVAGWILGPIFIIAMLVHGSNKATKWFCGDCGNQVWDKNVRQCPSCHRMLTR